MLGILFAQNAEGRIVGAVTDGDIRRLLLTGASIHGEVGACVNRNFVWARAGGPREQILKLLDQRVHVVPILDTEGRLVEVFSRELFSLNEESEVFARARSPVATASRMRGAIAAIARRHSRVPASPST